ncbi:MAG: GNAT family N-acetyltransferase [Cyclobacteriaceae bacterium]
MKIRAASPEDRGAIWEIFSEVIKSGDTYVMHPETPKSDLDKHWLAPYMHTYVAENDGQVLATYIIKPNQIDLGSHVANASYMVHPNAQGQGIGKLMCEHSLVEAKRLGFLAMQFNIVVSTNVGAVKVWEKFGFKTIGTIPKGFNHMKQGLVDAYIMYREL